MPTCVHCGVKTELIVKDVPICVSCDTAQETELATLAEEQQIIERACRRENPLADEGAPT